VEKRKERIATDVVSLKPMEEPPPVILVPPPVEKVEKKERTELREPSPLKGQKTLSQGDYEGFLKENEKVLSAPGSKGSKDEALFNLGLVYAHPGNPRKDYGKSIGFFNRLLKEYPQSPLSDQAKTWVGVLQENERLNEIIERYKKVDIEIEERKREKTK
jgi:tetratricopeptide (TPR) repeat protein